MYFRMGASMEFEVNGKIIKTDAEGYLAELGDWSEQLAAAIAQKEGLNLTDSH